MKEKRAQPIRKASRSVRRAARKHRQEPTDAEAVLWNALRGRKLGGLKFRRQHAVGRFVLDFYCAAKKLAVEVDGSIHDDSRQRIRDRVRTQRLKGHDVRVVRVRNREVFEELDAVLMRIAEAAEDHV